jgi:hypothetical protein
MIVGTGLLSSFSLMGQTTPTPVTSLPEITLWSRLTMGQVVSSPVDMSTYDYAFEGEWLENIDGGVRLIQRATPSITGRLNVAFQVNASRVRQRDANSVELTGKMFSAALLDASILFARHKLFGWDDSLIFEAGYFPFKYNQQSTNLGEYLFRSGTYPGVLVSGFEHSIDRPKIAGVHGAWKPVSFAKIDAIMNTELDIYPLHDIHATVIASGAAPKIGSLSFGVQFAHLISVDDKKLTPGTDKGYHPRVDQWVGYVDPNSAQINPVSGDTTYDTTLYTFRGTKLMARATLDIRGLIEHFTGALPFFGQEDLKVYGEGAILGVKNYPGWYNKRSERIPTMAGINLPTFKILDVLSVEVEHYPSPYWNSQEFIWKSHSPVPYTGVNGSAGMNYRAWADSLGTTNDDIKWSIYASKKFAKWFRLSGQVACDHTPRNWYTAGPPSFVKYTEMVPRTEDWYFMLRTSFYF